MSKGGLDDKLGPLFNLIKKFIYLNKCLFNGNSCRRLHLNGVCISKTGLHNKKNNAKLCAC